MELHEAHAAALESTRRFVAQVGSDRWQLATPCEDWDVRAVVNHVTSGNLWAVELMAGRTIEEVGDRLDGDVLGDDPLGAYETSASAAAEVFAAPGAMERPAAVSYGPVPGRVYCGHRLLDALIHGWDIAKGAGLDTTLDAALVEEVWAVVEPEVEGLRSSGAFGDGSVVVPAGADRQTVLLAALGRSTGWPDA